MKSRIFRSTIVVAIAVLIASFGIIMSCLYTYFGGIQESQMRDELQLALAGVKDGGIDYLTDLNDQNFRLTWIAPDGDILFDSRADETEMENHANRKEVKSAFAYGEGSDDRYSSTMLEKTLYYAKCMDDGSVLRIAETRATAGLLLIGMLQPLAIVIILAILLSAFLSQNAAKRIIQPLNELNLEAPLENETYEELAPLLERIHRQHQQIHHTMLELKQSKDEFMQITQSMNEGLVLLNEKGKILSMNPAARQIFHVASSCIGQDFLTIERSYDVCQMLQESFQTGHGEIRNQRDGAEYQIDFSRITSDGRSVGMVVLAFDVTQQAQIERSRREFTANVSHELKTPLQSIMGSAELIENGIVSAEDMPRFVGHIRTEAARLVTMINDIIQLSQMDDGVQLATEPVDLLDLAAEAVEAVKGAADAKQIHISVKGTRQSITGDPRLLFELIYNLCDNAVKYNVEKGFVEISITKQEHQVMLSVKDSGIGIPEEHLPRIFERFYRVDKSHSKASGGTGLGLSIVKHAAICHHASLDIQSQVGQGTEITVAFPV